jgi:TetR/AcrR family tetracycline transcriptional repressor
LARPKVPLISRRKALDAALKIMDTEGLEALSIRRLADELGVNGASLYHHFANKEEIVVGATEIALARVRTPTATDEDWRTWLPRNSRLLRRAMLDHPELVPIIVRKGELGMGMEMLDSSANRLVEEGVSIGAILPLLDALEMFAIGSAIHETRGDDGDVHTLPRTSVFARAAKARSLSADEMYEAVTKAIVEAVEAAVAAKELAGGKPAGRRRASARKQTAAAKPVAAGPTESTAAKPTAVKSTAAKPKTTKAAAPRKAASRRAAPRRASA